MVYLIPHVRDYPNQEYQAELCNLVLLKLLLPTWTIYLLVVPYISTTTVTLIAAGTNDSTFVEML